MDTYFWSISKFVCPGPNWTWPWSPNSCPVLRPLNRLSRVEAVPASGWAGRGTAGSPRYCPKKLGRYGRAWSPQVEGSLKPSIKRPGSEVVFLERESMGGRKGGGYRVSWVV